VFTRPSSLSDVEIVDALAAHWGQGVDRVEYAPVGFGSHHWFAGTTEGWELFVTVDDLTAKANFPGEPLDRAYERLDAAFTTSRDLADLGCRFVVAPLRARDGDVLHRLDGLHTIACFPYLDGQVGHHGAYRSEQDRAAVAELLVTLHQIDRPWLGNCHVEDFELSNRDELVLALHQIDVPWSGGPFSEPTRELLRASAEGVARRLGRYDEHVSEARPTREHWVITHGEPHGSNALTTADEVVLIDWDTVLIAPRERDVWHLDADDTTAAGLYVAAGGPPLDDALLDLYRLQWDLSEIAGYTTHFRDRHDDTDDARESFVNLTHSLERCNR